MNARTQLAAALLVAALHATHADPVGMAAYDLATLPVLRTGRTHLASSADPSGGNNDRGHFIRRDGTVSVLMEATGPGMLTRIWSANPQGMLRILLDGESQPRVQLPFAELAKPANETPTVLGWCSDAGGGVSCWYPMPFAKSCRVEVEGADQLYYQINYVTYPAGTEVATFKPALPKDLNAADWGEESTQQLSVPAGGDGAIFSLDGARTIHRLTLELDPSSLAVLRQLRLQMTWDGADGPSVDVPLLDLFASGLGSSQFGSAPVAAAGWNLFQLDFPLSFASHGVGRIHNASGSEVKLTARTYSTAGRAEGAGWFHAQGHAAQTVAGKPQPVLSLQGRGQFVGLAACLRGDGELKFLEGDERIVVDGGASPADVLQGTGTEDCFDGAWFFRNGSFANPFAGCTALLAGKSRVAAYRWWVADAVPFGQSLDVTLEHGPTNDAPGATYRTVAYWYGSAPTAVQPMPFDLAPDPYTEKADAGILLEAESLAEQVVLTGAKSATIDDSATALQASGGKALAVTFDAAGGNLGLPVSVKQTGLYDVALRLVGGGAAGELAAKLDEHPVPTPPVGYGSGEPVMRLGRVRIAAGQHVLNVAVKPSSGGTDRILVDYVLLRPAGLVKDAVEAEEMAPAAHGGKAEVVTETPPAVTRADDLVGGAIPTEAVCSGGAWVRFTPIKAGDRCDLTFNVTSEGEYGLAASLLRGPDFGACNVALDGTNLTTLPLSCEAASPTVGGRAGLGSHTLRQGRHKLSFAAAGPKVGAIGIDYLLLRKATKGSEAEYLVAANERARGVVVKERFGSEPRWSGGAFLRVPGGAAGEAARFSLFAPRAGRYAVRVVEALLPTAGKFNVVLNGQPVGSFDGHDAGEAVGKGKTATLRLKQGANVLMLTPTDGGDMALDVIEMTYEGGGGRTWPIGGGIGFVVVLVLVARRRRKAGA